MSSPSTWWINGTIYTGTEKIEQGRMCVSPDGQIEQVGGAELRPPENVPVHDLQGAIVVPGFIDVHVHGGNGSSAMTGKYEDLNNMSNFHAQHGTTSFLATTMAAGYEETLQALTGMSASMDKGLTGAEVVGIHAEGPFINLKRAGAQPPEHIYAPNLEELKQFFVAANNNIRMVTLAVEMPGADELVEWLVERGVTVSIGHSDATYAQTKRAVEMGVTHTTHHFNGMSPFHHREPGLAGAGLMLPELTTEVIADGDHVHPAAVKFLFDSKTAEQVCVITDAVFCAGLPDGDYGWVRMANGKIQLKDADNLAGSSLTLIKALHNVLEFTGYPLEKVLPSFTLVPARQIKMEQSKGSLAQGKDADFLILDEHLQIEATYVRGQAVYVQEDRH